MDNQQKQHIYTIVTLDDLVTRVHRGVRERAIRRIGPEKAKTISYPTLDDIMTIIDTGLSQITKTRILLRYREKLTLTDIAKLTGYSYRATDRGLEHGLSRIIQLWGIRYSSVTEDSPIGQLPGPVPSAILRGLARMYGNNVTVGDALHTSYDTFLRMPNVGPVRIAVLKKILARGGFDASHLRDIPASKQYPDNLVSDILDEIVVKHRDIPGISYMTGVERQLCDAAEAELKRNIPVLLALLPSQRTYDQVIGRYYHGLPWQELADMDHSSMYSDHPTYASVRMRVVRAVRMMATAWADECRARLSGKHSISMLQEIPIRTKEALKRAGLNTIEDVSSRTPEELLKVPGIAEKRLRDIIVALENAGYDTQHFY